MRMKLWTMPRYYFGATWEEYYVVTGRHRDSSLLDNSNYEITLARLKAEASKLNWLDDDNPALVDPHESHWAVGWVEWIGVHKDCRSLIDMAEDILDQLDDYPVLDEEDWSKRQYEAFETFTDEAIRFAANRHSLDLTDEQKEAIAQYIYEHCEDSGGSDGDGHYPSDEEADEAIREVMGEEVLQ